MPTWVSLPTKTARLLLLRRGRPPCEGGRCPFCEVHEATQKTRVETLREAVEMVLAGRRASQPEKVAVATLLLRSWMERDLVRHPGPESRYDPEGLINLPQEWPNGSDEERQEQREPFLALARGIDSRRPQGFKLFERLIDENGRLLGRGYRVIIPEIADYEVRRELIRAGKTRGRGARFDRGHSAAFDPDPYATGVPNR